MTRGIRHAAALVAAAAVFLSGCAHTLTVTSVPPGAEVVLDSQVVGKTPLELRIKDLDYGTHTVAVQKDGFEMVGRPQEIQVDFRRGLLVSSILFFYTPFPWIRVAQTGYKGVTNLHDRSTVPLLMRFSEGPRTWPLHFDHAVRVAANDLFAQVAKQRGKDNPSSARFVTDPVIDSNTGEVTNVSLRVEDLMRDEVRHEFPQFALAPMTSQNIDSADYVISGIVPLENYRDNADKSRHLSLSAVDRQSGKIVAHSDAWIEDIDLVVELTPLYRDSPMYLKDRRVEALIATAKAAAGTLADKEYFDSLATSALLSEAAKAYDQGDYRLALGLFAKAAERADGKIMKTFSGLYQSFFKLDQTAEAEKAFATLADLGMRNGNLGVKFLFNVNATEFSQDDKDVKQYPIWLRQIARTIVDSESCVRIVGHASHSGTAEHNYDLSTRRAKLVRDELKSQSSAVDPKTTAIGRGFDENIIGTGSNDATDAIDRRVEFKLAPCGT